MKPTIPIGSDCSNGFHKRLSSASEAPCSAFLTGEGPPLLTLLAQVAHRSPRQHRGAAELDFPAFFQSGGRAALTDLDLMPKRGDKPPVPTGQAAWEWADHRKGWQQVRACLWVLSVKGQC